MIFRLHYQDFLPKILPKKSTGKMNLKICIRKDLKRTDGTSSLYLNIFHENKSKKIGLGISVQRSFFDEKKKRVKSKHKFSRDYNLIIEKKLADINTIEVNYRLSNRKLTIKKLIEELENPSLYIDFVVFSENLIKYQLENSIIKNSTYRQQKGFLQKLKRFKSKILFSELDSKFLEGFISYLKKIHNKKSTIAGTLKNFKKFLRAANNTGVKTPLKYNDIKVGSMQGDFTFLLPDELQIIFEFYKSPFVNPTWKNILQRYIFSCFTGLRISDIEVLIKDNFIGDYLIWTSIKGNKINKILLNDTAKSLIKLPHIFEGNYTREHINRELKAIAKVCGIKKRLYYHSSRHTFGTNYLISGGSLVNLKKAMGHSKIETTMIYAHAVDYLMNNEIQNMDNIIEPKTFQQ